MAVESLAKRFMARFVGLERAHGTYEIGAGTRVDQKNKLKGRALTKLEPVTEELWELHLAGKRGLGIVPIRDDATCSFGSIDIDVYDKLDLPSLEAKCAALNLPLIVCRTKSGGAHLHLFTSEPVAASEIRHALVEWASALGHPKVEVFPKQVQMAGMNDVGNWINMPYFDSARTTRYAIVEGKAISPEQFLQLAEKRAISRSQLASVAVVPVLGLEDGPPCLQFLAREGFGEGGRNNALFNLGIYCRLRSNADAAWLQGGETWEGALQKMNEQFMAPILDKREVKEIVGSLRRKNYFYLCNMPPISAHCNKDLCKQRRYGVGNGHTDEEAIATLKMDNPRRVLTEPVTWIVTIQAKDLELTTDELMDQLKFRRRALEKLKILLPPLKRKSWEAVVQHVADTAQDMEAPNDAGPEGRLINMLEAFCTNHAEAKAKDELLLGRPWTDDKKRTHFRGGDFMRYLDQHHFRDMKERGVWAALLRKGAEHSIVKLKGKELTCWSVPAFARQDEDFSPARVDVEEF